MDGKFEKLSNDKASANVAKISCFGSLDKEWYEHGFLYLPKNSKVYEHLYDKDIEFYKLVTGGKSFKDSACLLGEKHEIKEVCCDTIIEIFKLNKNIIKQYYDINLLNKYLIKQAERYLSRINQLLIKLAYDKNDFCYKDLETLAFEYQISIDELNRINDIYFYKKEYLPFNLVELNNYDAGCEFREIPYQIDNIWTWSFDYKLTNKSNSLESTINQVRNRQTKSLIKAKDIFLN